MSDSNDERTGMPLFEGFSDPASPPPSSKKRKQDAPTKDEKKSSKRRKLKRPKDLDEEALDADLGVNHAIAHMDSRLMADHIAQRTKRFRPELSLVEMEELHVPGWWSELL
jgi:protein CMS1